MIAYSAERHATAKKDMAAAGQHAYASQRCGVAVALAARIIAHQHPSVLVIDSDHHLIPAGGISIGGSGISFRKDDDSVIVMPLDAITSWGQNNGTYGAEFNFEWKDADDRSRDVALVSQWREGDAGYAIAVECAIMKAMSETEDRWCVSDLYRGIGSSDKPLAFEPALLPDEVPGDDHELVWNGGRIRIGDVCALECVHEDCYQEYHVVTSDGRYLRFVFGEFDR